MKKIIHFLLILAIFFIPFGNTIGEMLGYEMIIYIYYLCIILAFMFLLFKNNFKVRTNILPKYMKMFLFYIILHTIIIYFFYADSFFRREYLNDSAFVNSIRLLSSIILLYVLIATIDNQKLKDLIIAYSIGYLVAFSLSFYFIDTVSLGINNIENNRFSGGVNNPNTFGVQSIMCLYFNLYLFLNYGNKGKWMKYLYLVFIFISLTGVMLSESRMAFFGFILGILIILFSREKIKKKYKLFKYIVFVVVLFYQFVPQNIYIGLFDRISNHSIFIKSGSEQESRIIIWGGYLDSLPDYIIQGVGFNREISIISNDYSTIIAFQPHNMYLLILTNFGIVGLLLFIRIFIDIHKSLNRKGHSFQMIPMYAVFLIWVIIFLNIGQYMNSKEFWFTLAILISFNKINVEQFTNNETGRIPIKNIGNIKRQTI